MSPIALILAMPARRLRAARSRSLATSRVMLLVLGIGLIPLSMGIWVLERQSQHHARTELDRSLTNEARQQAANLENYFARARAVVLLSAQNPVFQRFYELPGTRAQKIRAGGATMAQVNGALAYLESLYPASIGEACFIDRDGAENARVVRGTVASLADLSPDESKNPFFAPTFAIRHGQVYQARPYVSPDTREWVISNSTLVPTADGSKQAIVHFEVTIESFRRAASSAGYELAVVDASTRRIVFDSRLPQRVGAPLGRPRDARFTSLVPVVGPARVTDLPDARIAYQRLQRQPGNANDWYIIAVADPVAASGFQRQLPILGLIGAALLLVAFAMGRRWANVNRDLVAERTRSEEELRASEERYRELFEEAEEARRTLVVQNEQLRQLDLMKDEFVALVSHELRTPLTSICGYLELVIEEEAGDLTDQQREFLSVVERNADRLLRLVNDLLFVARVEAGAFELQLEDVDAADLIRGCIEAARPQAEEKGIRLLAEIKADAVVLADRSRLAQLLDNLVSNALKFTPAGGTVRVGANVSGESLELAVVDTGMGIPPTEQKHLFERFFRASSASSQAIPGTGLGLSITKAIAEAHGGSVSFESVEGEGTTFWVTLPLRAAVMA